MRVSRVLRMFAPLLLAVALGCGGPEEVRPELHPVSGTLTVNGDPAEGAMLVLHPRTGDFDARGTRPRATVNADGSFEVTTYQSGDGAPSGTYDVAILWFDNPDANRPVDRLGGRYANHQRTDIQVTVTEGANQLDPIVIDGVRVAQGAARGNSRDADQIE